MSLEFGLESGPYFISSVRFASGELVSRSLGESRNHEGEIVVQPLGSPSRVVSSDILMIDQHIEIG